MGIKVNIQTARTKLKGFVGSKRDEIITILQYVGEEFAKNAKKMKKSQGGFGDRSKNLRSSIGYVILHNGYPVMEYFEGEQEGIDESKKVISSIPKKMGFQLIGIAGMNYASIVEGKGMNVISIQAKAALERLKEDLKDVTQ